MPAVVSKNVAKLIVVLGGVKALGVVLVFRCKRTGGHPVDLGFSRPS